MKDINRLREHCELVDFFYNRITTDIILIPTHDRDKVKSEFWQRWYAEGKPNYLYSQWVIEDKKHRINSNHHIDCLLNGRDLNWEELVSDFFAVNLRHNRSPRKMMKIIRKEYAYALPEIKKYLSVYKAAYSNKGRLLLEENNI